MVEEYTKSYWNNSVMETKKQFFIEQCGPMGYQEANIRNYLFDSGLLEDLNRAFAIASLVAIGEGRGQHLDGRTGGFNNPPYDVADIGCGTGWAMALLSQSNLVRTLTGVDFSNHRILMVPNTVAALGGDIRKIKATEGSFYETGLATASCHFVILSQAFHHAKAPRLLIREMKRILIPSGFLLLIHEHVFPNQGAVVRRLLKNLVLLGKLNFKLESLFTQDSDAGDHFYPRGWYLKFFRGNRLEVVDSFLSRDQKMYNFILRRGA